MNVPIRTTPESWGAVAQLLHWLVAAGVFVQFAWAWRIAQAGSIRDQFILVNQHKSIGMCVLVLALLRLGWRAFNPPPPYPPGMPGWERRAARWSHRLLYAMIVVMPLSGWAWTSAAGFGVEWFGRIGIPDIAPSDERLEAVLGTVHRLSAVAIAVLVSLHVLAALRHHLVLRDDILKRMLPLWR